MDIIKTLKEKQILIIWIVAFVLLIVLILLTAVFNVGKTQPKQQVLDINLGTVNQKESTQVAISNTLISKTTIPNTLSVYKTSNKDYESKVNTFIANYNLNLPTKNCNEFSCRWEGADGQIELDKQYSTLNIKLTKPVKVDSGIDSLTSENYVEFFKKLMSGEFEISNEYFGESFNRSGDNFKFTLSRKLNNYKIYSGNYSDTTDYAVASTNGSLIEAKISTFDVLTSSKTDYESIGTDKIATLINTNGYPKTVAYGVDSPQSETSSSQSIPTNSEGSGQAFAESVSGTKPLTCTADSIDIVYYYADTRVVNLLPVYKVHCVGSATDSDGNTIKVPAIVYASAINPQYTK